MPSWSSLNSYKKSIISLDDLYYEFGHLIKVLENNPGLPRWIGAHNSGISGLDCIYACVYTAVEDGKESKRVLIGARYTKGCDIKFNTLKSIYSTFEGKECSQCENFCLDRDSASESDSDRDIPSRCVCGCTQKVGIIEFNISEFQFIGAKTIISCLKKQLTNRTYKLPDAKDLEDFLKTLF